MFVLQSLLAISRPSSKARDKARNPWKLQWRRQNRLCFRMLERSALCNVLHIKRNCFAYSDSGHLSRVQLGDLLDT